MKRGITGRHQVSRTGDEEVRAFTPGPLPPDPPVELANARQTLKAEGHLLVFVPALKLLYSNVDKQMGHYRRYTQKSLVGLVEDVGFTLLKVRYFDMAGIIPWYVNCVLLRNSFSSGGVSLYDKLAVPTVRFLESVVPPPVGKNVLLIAKKN